LPADSVDVVLLSNFWLGFCYVEVCAKTKLATWRFPRYLVEDSFSTILFSTKERLYE
jgi:hypothetical protein